LEQKVFFDEKAPSVNNFFKTDHPCAILAYISALKDCCQIMIAYDLQCPNGHCFEGWFEDATAFEKQCNLGQITCPQCSSGDVVRIPSTFAIKSARSGASRSPQVRRVTEAEILTRAVRNYVETHFDNVGTDFATEALKIHYGVTEPRNIRGISTAKEEESLRLEGVEFFKMPVSDDPMPDPSSSSSEPDA
jgi:hypothetical protein